MEADQDDRKDQDQDDKVEVMVLNRGQVCQTALKCSSQEGHQDSHQTGQVRHDTTQDYDQDFNQDQMVEGRHERDASVGQ